MVGPGKTLGGSPWPVGHPLPYASATPVREGVSTDYLKFHFGPPCPTLIRPADGPPSKRPSSSPLDTPSRTGLASATHDERISAYCARLLVQRSARLTAVKSLHQADDKRIVIRA
jgi:hypothetical protein